MPSVPDNKIKPPNQQSNFHNHMLNHKLNLSAHNHFVCPRHSPLSPVHPSSPPLSSNLAQSIVIPLAAMKPTCLLRYTLLQQTTIKLTNKNQIYNLQIRITHGISREYFAKMCLSYTGYFTITLQTFRYGSQGQCNQKNTIYGRSKLIYLKNITKRFVFFMFAFTKFQSIKEIGANQYICHKTKAH